MDMYSEITTRVDAYYARIKVSNKFYQAMHSGELTSEALSIYLQDMKVSLKATIGQCAIGAANCSKSGDKKLQAFFQHKIEEESGHDQWAQEDLDNLQKKFKISRSDLSNEMKNLVSYNTKLVANDPRLYLVYMLFAEYFTVKAAGECLDAIESKCGIPKSMLSVLSKHADLDREHVEEWRVTVEECDIDMIALYPQVMEVLGQVMDNYEKFWNYVGECNKHYAKKAA